MKCSWDWRQLFLSGSSTLPPPVGWRHFCETSPRSWSKNREDELDVVPGERKVLLCDDAADAGCSQRGHRKVGSLAGGLGEGC